MTSSRQPRELNLGSFMAWAASRTDDEFRAIAHRGALSRKEIAKECGVGRSALDQNPRMLEVIEQRAGAKSVLITSQLPIDRWHDYLTTGGKSGAGGNATQADAMLDRLVSGSHRLELRGDSLRKSTKAGQKGSKESSEKP